MAFVSWTAKKIVWMLLRANYVKFQVSDEFCIADGPVIMPMSDSVLKERSDAWFNCEAPNAAELWWTFGGRVITSSDRRIVYPNGTLYIR